jgi:rare lipoprotein A
MIAVGIWIAISPVHAENGIASFYGSGQTAKGEVSRPSEFTAAHRTLPFGTKVLVTNVRNGRNVVVRINDRGPFKRDRIIDLSRAAARELDMIDKGIATISIVQEPSDAFFGF